MKSKIILSIAGITGALALILSGCSLIGTGGNSFGNDVKEEIPKEMKETSVAEKTKETITGDGSEKSGETQADKEAASEECKLMEVKGALPVTEGTVSDDANELTANIEAKESF